MKFRKLFLKAFGPFTDTELDFTGPANLHVIYGPNEAGKSSALRAMGDLRYGIPPQSNDNFIHDFKAMLVAGTFEDAAGRVHALARRKGNKDTLMWADPLSGAAAPGSPVTPDVLLALTGGVERKQFETMYGLHSAHLREGGQQLIQGSGELGAALFEASTGAAGIKTLLTSLQDKAKTYYAPRSQSAQLNEATKQLDAARQRYKQAVTKPEQWKALKRTHDEATLRLSDIRQQLAALRRRDAELAGLRAVAPTVRQLDQAEAAWAEVEAFVALPEDTRERRLAAQLKAQQASLVLSEANAQQAASQAELGALSIEQTLLDHGTAIDRLTANAAMVRRDRDQRLSLSEATQADAKRQSLEALRLIAPGLPPPDLDEFYARAPSPADQASLLNLMDDWLQLSRDAQAAQAQEALAHNKLQQLDAAQLSEPPAAMQQDLGEALALAQSLGDVDKRITSEAAAHDAEQRKLDRLLLDLNLPDVAALTSSRWLATADIDAHERDRGALASQIAVNEAEARKTASDLAEQTLRRQRLAATGEVVTADTVKAARVARDQTWQAVRAAFVDTPHRETPEATATQAKADLPAVFEQAKAEADRQADLLSAGAQRAAEVAECELRIAAMTDALEGLRQAVEALVRDMAAQDEAWHHKLAQLGMPRMSAAAARDWVSLRQKALDGLDHVKERSLTLTRLREQVTTAASQLAAVLSTLGHAPHGSAEDLVALVAQAKAIDQAWVQLRTAQERRVADMAEQRQLRLDAGGKLRQVSERMAKARAALDTACARLHLPAGAAPELIKARSLAVQAWAEGYRQHLNDLRQLRLLTATETALRDDAAALWRSLGEAPPDHLEAWLDTLAQRLIASRDAIQKKDLLAQRLHNEGTRKQRATDDLAASSQALNALVLEARVHGVEDLPEAEERSKLRQAALTELARLRAQLASASDKDIATLRTILANQDALALDAERRDTAQTLASLEAQEHEAITAEQAHKLKLDAIDTSDEAAQAREEMEAAIARYRAGIRPWAQLKLAEALLSEALRRHRDKAQGPVVALASAYFQLMTGGRFARLLVDSEDDKPVLLAQPDQGKAVSVSALSEGTADQLYLALRLAALEVQRSPERVMPLVLDDVFMTADDERAVNMFKALERFSAQTQVLVFTHHRHLTDIAERTVRSGMLCTHQLQARS